MIRQQRAIAKSEPRWRPPSTRTEQRNCTNSQSVIYFTGLTNIYQEQDCLTTKIPPRKKENSGVTPPSFSVSVTSCSHHRCRYSPLKPFQTPLPHQNLLNPNDSSEKTKKFKKKHLDFFFFFFSIFILNSTFL